MSDITQIDTLAGDPTRATVLATLLGGRALTAQELACVVHVPTATISGHLACLTSANLLATEKQGQHRYFHLALPLIGDVRATVMSAAAREPGKLPSWRGGNALRTARTCYDHFAGRLGVALADALTQAGHLNLSAGCGELTERGHAFMCDFGASPGAGRRVFCRSCLDWSERRPHIAGRLGAALAGRCLDLRWIQRQPASRAVTITTEGTQGFAATFGIQLP